MAQKEIRSKWFLLIPIIAIIYTAWAILLALGKTFGYAIQMFGFSFQQWLYVGSAVFIILIVIAIMILQRREKYERAPQAKTTTICNFCGAQTKSPQVFTKDGKHYWWCGECSAGFPHKEEAIERLAELEARRKAEEEEEVRTKLDAELEAMQKNIPNIFLDDIKTQLSKGDFDKVEQLLAERKKDYGRYIELGRSLKDIEEEVTMLSRRLAKGELTSDAYERASDALERKRKDIDEELWKIQRKIFRERYEKPF